MSATQKRFNLNDLGHFAPRWDELISADLAREVDHSSAASAHDTRLALAIQGYRAVHDILVIETADKYGAPALRAMALAFRRYAKERPGIAVVTFRSPRIESAEWLEAASAVRQLFIAAFKQYGLDEIAAGHAMRIFRSIVQGYVMNEMTGSFYLVGDNDESFDLAVDVFLRGLPALMPHSHEGRSRSYFSVAES